MTAFVKEKTSRIYNRFKKPNTLYSLIVNNEDVDQLNFL